MLIDFTQIWLICEVNFHSKTKFLASNLRQFQAGKINFTAKSKLISHKVQLQPKQNNVNFARITKPSERQISNQK